jgi:hypothetical protein
MALTSVSMVPDVDVDLDPGSGTECGSRHWLNVEPEAVLLRVWPEKKDIIS